MFATWNYKKHGSINHATLPEKQLDNKDFANYSYVDLKTNPSFSWQQWLLMATFYPYGASVTLPDGATVSKNFTSLRGAKQWISKIINKHYNFRDSSVAEVVS